VVHGREDPRIQEALTVLDAVARGVARQLGGRFDLDDLKGYAHEAIAELVARFDPARGVSFRGYARLRLRGAILDGLRKESGLPRGVAGRLRALEAADLYAEAKGEENAVRAPNAAVADARLSSFLRGLATAYATGLVAKDDAEGAPVEHDASRVDPEAVALRSQLRAKLLEALDAIGDPEATILRRHYFLDEDLQDAAAHVGLSKSWGSRLHARGIEKLAGHLASLRGAL
jgi:RNA polymerase sigma factor for flagellar operon FliA